MPIYSYIQRQTSLVTDGSNYLVSTLNIYSPLIMGPSLLNPTVNICENRGIGGQSCKTTMLLVDQRDLLVQKVALLARMQTGSSFLRFWVLKHCSTKGEISVTCNSRGSSRSLLSLLWWTGFWPKECFLLSYPLSLDSLLVLRYRTNSRVSHQEKQDSWENSPPSIT